MTAASTRFTTIKDSLHACILILLVALPLAACTEGITDPGLDEIPPEPEVQTRTVCDLDLTTHHIHVSGSCDKTFGQPVEGEFQWRYEISGGGQFKARESENYNKRTGVVISKMTGRQINFPNKTYRWRGMASPASINVKLFGTEWDVAGRDHRMNNRNGAREVPFKLGKSSRTVTIGATKECQIYLAYDATWREREVAD